ncbi:DUF6515 family protein [Pelagicoccus sp. SDUM812005]|uniref:DUF6515 family protein n=1 Tax=Pelagicoccus sp. SDUM812005 TaxID=3041257 RepID=UPI00281087BC|nr:DUF6515 family protein [Pelagicoccus sp. SDUM812005]MDQ8180621.1 DUF6515 family protein [Pelagicoccus sp. SDUM812005]
MNTKPAKTLLVAALLATAAFSPALLPETHANPRVSIGANIGLSLPNGAISVHVGNERYHYHEGRYFKKTPRGYVSVKAPRGAAIRKLPRGYAKVVIGGHTYYRYGTVYYVKRADRYIVVDEPEIVVVEKESSAPAVAADATPAVTPYSVWVDGERELVMKNGQFFRKSPQGLIWVALPVGATAKELPADSVPTWYQEIEYFEKNGVYFKKTPDGYQVILPPWEAS